MFLQPTIFEAADIYHQSVPSPGVQGKAGMGSMLIHAANALHLITMAFVPHPPSLPSPASGGRSWIAALSTFRLIAQAILRYLTKHRAYLCCQTDSYSARRHSSTELIKQQAEMKIPYAAQHLIKRIEI